MIDQVCRQLFQQFFYLTKGTINHEDSEIIGTGNGTTVSGIVFQGLNKLIYSKAVRVALEDLTQN